MPKLVKKKKKMKWDFSNDLIKNKMHTKQIYNQNCIKKINRYQLC